MKYLICFGLLVSSLLCNSQTREKGDVELTPITRYSSSSQLNTFLLSSSSVYEVQLGIYGNYFLNQWWSLITDLLYQKIGTNNGDFLTFIEEYSERTNYITVPLMVNYYHFGAKRHWCVNYDISVAFLKYRKKF